MKKLKILISLGLILGLDLIAETLSLELIKELRFKERIGVEGQIGGYMGVITSEEQEKRIRKIAKLSPDEPIFPIRALKVGDKIKIFDEKGKVEREIEGGSLISPNGEYILKGNKVIDREGKTLWQNKDLKGWVVAISNKGNVVATEVKRGYLKDLYFYDSEGNLIKKVDFKIKDRHFPMRFLVPETLFQLSEDGSTFVTWNGEEVIVLSEKGEELFRYKIEASRKLDKVKVSPDGRYIVVSCETGGTHTVYPKDYNERVRKAEETIKKLENDLMSKYSVIYSDEQGREWLREKEKIDQEVKKIREEIKSLAKEVYFGPIKQSVFFFTRKGKLINSYDVVEGEIAISFSPEGDYIGVGDYHNVYLFEAKTGKLKWRYHIKPPLEIESSLLGVSSNGKYVTAGVLDKTIHHRYLWIFTDKQIIKKDLGTSYTGFINTYIDLTADQIVVASLEAILYFNLKRRR